MTEPARILVADDDPQFSIATARLLERAGYVVERAADAEEALAYLTSRAFDLLVADVHMPGNHGLAVLYEQTIVPVLVVTGGPSVETAVSALRGSAVDYLAKPLSPTSFLERVADGVGRARMARKLRGTEVRLREQLELAAGLRSALDVAGAAKVDTRPEPETSAGLPSVITKQLSPREREVLEVFREIPRLVEVASELGISQHTVKNHFRSIYRKLGVSSQAELLTKLSQAERARAGR